jgi:hypothetical protein
LIVWLNADCETGKAPLPRHRQKSRDIVQIDLLHSEAQLIGSSAY